MLAKRKSSLNHTIMPKYCFPLSTFASSVAKHNDVALLVYTSFLMIVYEIWNPTWHNEYSSKLYIITPKCFYIILIFLNRSIRIKSSIISRFHHISLLIIQNHSGSAMVLETDQRETTMQRCGWRVLQSYVPAWI